MKKIKEFCLKHNIDYIVLRGEMKITILRNKRDN